MSNTVIRPDAFTSKEITSTGFALIAVTSAFAVTRIAIHLVAPKRLTAEDGLTFLAYVTNVAMCSLYISLAPIAERLTDVKAGKIKPYPGLKADGRFVSRRYFCTALLFWIVLWSIKFSCLLLYRKLLKGVRRVYTWAWWAIVIVCVGTQAGNYAAYLTACSDMYLFVNGGCKDMTTARQLVSLLYSYGADTITNLLIMALPIRLTWNLQMPRAKKLGVIALFATGGVCVTIATLRVAQITNNVNKYNQGIDGTWLAIWGMVECSIAVIVGFVPAFAVLARLVKHKKSYSPYGKGGYRKQSERSAGSEGFALGSLAREKRRAKKEMGLKTTDSLWVDEGSQEGLNPAVEVGTGAASAEGGKGKGIVVTTTVEQERGVAV